MSTSSGEFSPIYRLPPELIATILSITPGPRVQLSHISSLLRAIALSTAQLWSEIDFKRPDRLEELKHYLQFSANTLLHVKLALSGSTHLPQPKKHFLILDIAHVVEILRPHFHRVKSFDLSYHHWSSEESNAILRLFDPAAPRLETLRIYSPWAGHLPRTFLGGASKLLQTVRLNGISHRDHTQFLITCNTALQNLHLTLSQSRRENQDSLLNIIPIIQIHSPSLVELFLSLPSPFNYSSAGQLGAIFMATLEKLSICGATATPLVLIDAPRLQSVYLDFYDEEEYGGSPPDEFGDSFDTVIDFLRRHCASMQIISYYARDALASEVSPDRPIRPIDLPCTLDFRLCANAGQRILLPACNFRALTSLHIDCTPDISDGRITWAAVASCLKHVAPSLHNLRADAYEGDGPYSDPDSMPPIDLPFVESITLAGGAILLSKIASAPRLRKLIVTAPKTGLTEVSQCF